MIYFIDFGISGPEVQLVFFKLFFKGLIERLFSVFLKLVPGSSVRIAK